MGTGTLSIDLGALRRNWRSLDARSASDVETAACVKADGYGLGVDAVANALAAEGCRSFFVAVAKEGAELRRALGPGPRIFVFAGNMALDAPLIEGFDLIPLLNSREQIERHRLGLPERAFGIQLDSGMNRLGVEPGDWREVRASLPQMPELVISHLACADDPTHEMNGKQLNTFHEMTAGIDAPLSLAATGGTLLGDDYHFSMTRPGVGLYGGAPYVQAEPVVKLSLPVIQIRNVTAGETVGYGNAWVAERDSKIATLSAGYADGLIRALGTSEFSLYAQGRACPRVGRISMDLLTVDVTDVEEPPTYMEVLNHLQGIDALASAAGTIGYEILTSLGARYERRLIGS
ncbi:MAG: alanine racemase [Pseudomonadota bacterium]